MHANVETIFETSISKCIKWSLFSNWSHNTEFTVYCSEDQPRVAASLQASGGGVPAGQLCHLGACYSSIELNDHIWHEVCQTGDTRQCS